MPVLPIVPGPDEQPGVGRQALVAPHGLVVTHSAGRYLRSEEARFKRLREKRGE